MARILVIFKIGPCSAILFRSRRELSIDVAELKVYVETLPKYALLRLNFILETAIAFPKTGVLFLL